VCRIEEYLVFEVLLVAETEVDGGHHFVYLLLPVRVQRPTLPTREKVIFLCLAKDIFLVLFIQ
jgi:hypothetical protein